MGNNRHCYVDVSALEQLHSSGWEVQSPQPRKMTTRRSQSCTNCKRLIIVPPLFTTRSMGTRRTRSRPESATCSPSLPPTQCCTCTWAVQWMGTISVTAIPMMLPHAPRLLRTRIIEGRFVRFINMSVARFRRRTSLWHSHRHTKSLLTFTAIRRPCTSSAIT